MKPKNKMKMSGRPKAGSSKASTKGGDIMPKLGGKDMLGSMPVDGGHGMTKGAAKMAMPKGKMKKMGKKK